MRRVFSILALLLLLVLTFAARCWNLRDVFVEGRIYFVDADCYSRMTRARLVAEHPGTIVRHHDFENWPQGVSSHTTAPLDYLIVGLKQILDFGFWILDSRRTSVFHDQTLDLAGTLISPLLGVAGAMFLAMWTWALRLRFWGITLLLYAVSPILVHGTVLGRPDHQALLIVSLMVALGAELALARKTDGSSDAEHPVPSHTEQSTQSRALVGKMAWGIVAGTAWALSMWVSLYEPLILFATVLVLWLAFDRCALLAPARKPGWIVFAVILAVAFSLEGWRIESPDPVMRAYFVRWQATIGELAHLDLRSPLLFGWVGWSVVAAPVLLLLARKTDRRALAGLLALGMTFALTLWQVRWGYFFVVAFVLTVPWQMLALRRTWVAWVIFLAGLWPVSKEWDAGLFPEEMQQDRQTMQRAELVALRKLVAQTEGENAGPFLAPWWLSPPIAYWTRNPGVAGSSHESLPGIVETARFFLSIDPASAAAILRTRKVRWVLADEPSRTIGTASTLLGMPAPDEPLAKILADHPQDAPGFLQERTRTPQAAANPGPGVASPNFRPGDDGLTYYRLYLVDDAKLPP